MVGVGASTSDYFDALETRDPQVREREQLTQLPELIARAKAAPGWAKLLANVDTAAVTSRAALAKLPLLRKSDLIALQKANPPFGSLVTLGLSLSRSATMPWATI